MSAKYSDFPILVLNETFFLLPLQNLLPLEFISFHCSKKGENPWGKQEQCIVKLLETACCIGRRYCRLTGS